ncbi:hypothetical protein E2C01_100142 [Portunus trituberculatus]|uniref:Uncharacterized protein n=1 Tax=Portunus trituberculatus TaxID=210409 RepID=A0A5B7K5Z3_PORTR|nr:hypothetical protein [Portunus trituberculatus]
MYGLSGKVAEGVSMIECLSVSHPLEHLFLHDSRAEVQSDNGALDTKVLSSTRGDQRALFITGDSPASLRGSGNSWNVNIHDR